MALTDMTEDGAYRTLATDVLKRACGEVNIEVSEVSFDGAPREQGYSWLCFVVDPRAEDRVAHHTGSSAVDHLELSNPNGFLREAGNRIAVHVREIEVSDEAAMPVRDKDGKPILTSPWMANLAVAKVTFDYVTDYPA